jgi:hypothetical protein
MKRNLLSLNLALLCLVAFAVWKVQTEWTAQKLREDAVKNKSVPAPPLTVAPIPAPPAPVVAASYSDIANKMLFNKDRNPNVVVEVVEAPKPPMPPLPVLHGVMGLPSGMLALLSTDAKTPGKGVAVGEKMGPFELAALTRDEISFKWEDKTVTKSVSEMIYRGLEATAQQAPPAPGTGSSPSAGNAPASTGAAKPSAAVIGMEEIKTCDPGETSPNGTVSDGYKKVLMPTPFGNSCHWEIVK